MMIDNSGEANKNCKVTNQSSYNVEEAFRQLKIRDSHEQGGEAQANPCPVRPGEPNCSYYMKTGFCGYGRTCRYNHPLHSAQGTLFREELSGRKGQPVCGYFLKTGTCKYGFTCKYNHPKDRIGAEPVLFNILGLPIHPDEKSCPYYMRYGSCKFGVACKFHHPDPSSRKTGLLMNGPAAFGSPGSSVVPSSMPALCGIPVWSSSRALSVFDSDMQGVQAFVPVVFSVSPGTFPAPGWNTHMGSPSPVSSGGITASNMICNLMNHGESGFGEQYSFLLPTSASLLEKPSQPKCHCFMNLETCIYGPECKYHHPRERMALFLTSFVGPHALPSRPGQVACPNYTSYGLCKFGTTPVMDHHPLFGYSHGYSLSFPHPSFDASLATTSRILQTGFLSEMPLSPSSTHSGWIQIPNVIRTKRRNVEMAGLTSDHSSEQAESLPPYSSPDE